MKKMVKAKVAKIVKFASERPKELVRQAHVFATGIIEVPTEMYRRGSDIEIE